MSISTNIPIPKTDPFTSPSLRSRIPACRYYCRVYPPLHIPRSLHTSLDLLEPPAPQPPSIPLCRIVRRSNTSLQPLRPQQFYSCHLSTYIQRVWNFEDACRIKPRDNNSGEFGVSRTRVSTSLFTFMMSWLKRVYTHGRICMLKEVYKFSEW
jgi:hypothetical protein